MRAPGPKEKSSVYFTVLEACKGRGCPVCSLLTKGAQSYIGKMLYENVNDGDIRGLLRLSHGLCRIHSVMMTHGEDHFGIAIIYEDILSHIRRELMGGRAEDLSPLKECPVCSYRGTMESNYVGIVAGFLHENELMQALESCGGLCLVHLPQLMDQLAGPIERDEMLTLHVRTLEQIRGHLSEFVRKQDIQFRNEIVSHDEEMACEQAIDCLVGNSA